jgi:hypothetical protein
MKSTGLMIIAGVAAVSALAGSYYVGQTAPRNMDSRQEIRIGDQTPGPLIPSGSASWTPQRDPDGYTVTATLPLEDSRLPQFADFPLHLPEYLPTGSTLGPATVIWDPSTEKRIVQIPIQGKHSGMLSQQRVREHTEDYPDGMVIRTVKLNSGQVYRNLRSNVNGVGVSMAWNLALPDEQIIQSFQSLKAREKQTASGR